MTTSYSCVIRIAALTYVLCTATNCQPTTLSFGPSAGECVSDGGAIKRAPRTSKLGSGNKVIVVSEKYCMNFNDYRFDKTKISIMDAGEEDWRKYDRIVACDGIVIDRIEMLPSGKTAFHSGRISKPLLYDESTGQFENSRYWGCDFGGRGCGAGG